MFVAMYAAKAKIFGERLRETTPRETRTALSQSPWKKDSTNYRSWDLKTDKGQKGGMFTRISNF